MGRLDGILTRPEANDVFRQLRLNGVKVDCVSWRLEGIHAIESVLNKYKECCWHFMICSIAPVIQEELLKSKDVVIDVELIREVVEYLENDDDDEEEEDDKSDSDDEKDEKTRQECIKELLEQCSEMGFRVKRGQEEQILDLMIPYLRGSLFYFMAIKFFMTRVSELLHPGRLGHILKCALKSKILRQYDSYIKERAVSSNVRTRYSLKKNIIPTKEEGIATPMNQLKQEEKRECGDMMKFEECETATPLNLPEQEENMGIVYSCRRECMETEEWDIATRGGANKRKLAQGNLWHSEISLLKLEQ